MINPHVFLVGCPRSGTTLLRRIVNAHAQIAIMPESRWIVGFFEGRRGLTLEGVVTPGLIDYHGVPRPRPGSLERASRIRDSRAGALGTAGLFEGRS